MSTIAVDVDEVVASLHQAWLDAYNAEWDDSLSPNDIKNWEIHTFVKPNCGNGIYRYLDTKLYQNVKPVPGALEGVRELRQMGYRVLFVTSCTRGTIEAKIDWLLWHNFIEGNGPYGDGRVYPDFVPVHEKALIKADWLIDDGAHNINAFNGNTILFSRAHNQDAAPHAEDGFVHIRAFDWESIVLYFREMTESDEPVMLKPSAQAEFMATAGMSENQIAGVGPDAATVVSANGAKQSALPYRFDLVDPRAMFDLANILATGAEKYGEWNWRGLTVESNINHALSHLYAFLAGDKQDNHLGHALCRCMFAWSKANNRDPLKLMDYKEKK